MTLKFVIPAPKLAPDLIRGRESKSKSFQWIWIPDQVGDDNFVDKKA